MESKTGTIFPPEKPISVSNHAQWLSGQGVGTWFCINETAVKNQYQIKRYTPKGSLDCDRIFEIEESDAVFDINQPYEFAHISHCSKCRIKQQNNLFIFKFIQV